MCMYFVLLKVKHFGVDNDGDSVTGNVPKAYAILQSGGDSSD